jgi:hypothetical protein
MKPTEEQVKKVWEWCGFWYDTTKSTGLVMEIGWRSPSGKVLGGCHVSYLPKIDLNNLFKYAVPKLNAYGFYYATELSDEHRVWVEINGQIGGVVKDKDPALALFWAIYKVIEEKKDG